MVKALVLVLVFLCSTVSSVFAYTFDDLWKDVASDTREAYSDGLKAAYFHDFFEKDVVSRSKVGASFPIIAYSFVTLEGALIYTPKSSDEVASFGFSFPIRFKDIPVGQGLTLGDYIGKFGKNPHSKSWVDRLFVGPYFSRDFTKGQWGGGVTSGITF